MNPPPQYKLVPFPEPSNLCQASRIPGYVSLPSQPPTTTPTPMARSTHASSSSSATTNTPDQTASLDTARKVPIVAPLSSGLQRQASMAGNVLLLQKDNKDDTTTTNKTKKEYRAFLLQRKLEETPKGNYTIRAGYPLALLDYDKNNEEDDEDNRNSSLAHRIWQVEANAPLMAIHIHTMSADSDSTTTTTTSMAQESTMVQYNPRAEWFVWSHSCNDHNNALSSCLLGSEWMGSCSSSSKDALVLQSQSTAASSTMSMQQDDSSIGSSIALPQNSSLYYSVTPLYPTSLWDELCARQQQAKQEKNNKPNEASPSSSSALVTEDEARHVFTQILQCLERLQQLQLCHRNITLHNLLLVEDAAMPFQEEEEPGKTADGTTTTTGASQPSNTHRTSQRHRNLCHQRICLARHGWAVQVHSQQPQPNDDNDKEKMDAEPTESSAVLPLVPPSTALPLYLAPEWIASSTSSSSSQPEATQQQQQHAPTLDPFALDLWSASICLLIVMVGVEDMDRLLYSIPQAADPRFEWVTQHVQVYFNQRHGRTWSPSFCHLMQSLLHPNPQKRWTNLQQIQEHEWFTTTNPGVGGEDSMEEEVAADPNLHKRKRDT